ncbi:MAG: DNA gyrase subunit A [Bacillales bacterium]|jgi:DNA gyrase subunit A|nr:DNA gyrase subunit A [Bacillales bacterium]
MSTYKKDEGFERDFVHNEEIVDVNGELKKDFLEYAMSVIVARAIPDVRDGLKPVHRRIIYSMNEEGFTAGRSYNKSAKVVGAVMGNYHPHGDSSIYEAMVRLAQPFNTRYQLVDGHGNFGNIDGYGAAAQRYTEARLARLSSELIKDIDKSTVDFIDTYDGKGKEPVVLPAYFPNLLVNGTTGIAVGMATNMPPHNLGEIIDCIFAIMENPDIEVIDLMNSYIKGPDFPTGAIIMGKSGIRKAYETGRGSFVIRSKLHTEDMGNGKTRIIVSEIPYQTNKKTLIEKIANLVKTKVVEGIVELRDESNLEGIRIIIELKKDTLVDVLINTLYRLTPLQQSYSVNNLVLDKNEPKTLGIIDIIKKYLEHQNDVLVRKTQFQLDEANKRMHILRGFIKVLGDIDEAIKIIRTSKTVEEEFERFTKRFGLDDVQIKAVINMRLQALSNMEITKLEEEYKALQLSIDELMLILNSQDKRWAIIRASLEEIKGKYADERRTEISLDEFDVEDEDLIPQEDILITLTNKGYIKRLSLDTYKTQNRGGKGIKGMNTYEDDVVEKLLVANTHTDILFFMTNGKVYKVRGFRIPEGSRTSKGIPAVVNLLKAPKEEKIQSIICIKDYDDENFHLLFSTKKGILKRTSLDEYKNIHKNGKIAINLRDDDELVGVAQTSGNAEVYLANSNGKLARLSEEDIRAVGRNSIGVKGMNVDEGQVISMSTSNEGDKILVISNNGIGKMTPTIDYRATNRGAKGVITIKINEKTGPLALMKAVKGDEDILIITNKGIIIRTPLTQIREASRNTSGVKIIRLEEDQHIASIAVVEHIEEEIIEEEVED